MKAARTQAGEIQRHAKSAEKRGPNSAKRKRDTDTAPQIREDGLYAKHLDTESESSRTLRFSQLEIEEAVKAKDPSYELRQTGRVKKMPGLDRILIDRAFEERKDRMRSV